MLNFVLACFNALSKLKYICLKSYKIIYDVSQLMNTHLFTY